MKKQFSILIAALLLLFFSVIGTTVHAQVSPSTDDHTAREEAEGKVIWEKLQTKQLGCKDLTDNQYGFLGEYFMGQMVKTSHEEMNTMMENMMGKAGEEQMHIVMGQRLSGCEPNAQFPQSSGFMPMMWNWWGEAGWWLFQFTAVVWLIVGILAGVWLFRQISRK